MRRTAVVSVLIAAACLATAPAAPALSWQPPVTVSASGEEAYPFSRGVATDAAGDLMVAWLGVTSDTGGTWSCPCTVRAAYRPAGGSFGAPVDVSPTIADPDDALPVYVAMDAAGDATVAWTAPANSADPTALPDTAYAAVRPAGGPFGPPVPLAGPGGPDAFGGALLKGLTMDAAGDTAVLISNEQSYSGSGSGVDLVFDTEVVSSPAGGGFGAPEILSDGEHDAYGRAIAMSPNGKTAVEMEVREQTGAPYPPEPDSIQVAVSSAPGAPFGSPDTLETVSNPSLNTPPYLNAGWDAIDDAGEYVAIYELDEPTGGPYGVESSVWASIGGATSVKLSAPGESLPVGGPVVMNAGGESVAIWGNTEGEEFETTRPPGGAFGPAVPLQQMGGTLANATNVESANGAVLDAVDGQDLETETAFVKASIRAPGGAFPAPASIAPPNDDLYSFGVGGAIDGSGDAAVVWTNERDAVRVATFSQPAGGRPAGSGAASPSVPPSGAGGHPRKAGRPDTKLVRVKLNRRRRTARFTFSGSGGSGALTFQCKLDHQRFRRCKSPHTYRKLKPGKHTFQVRAVDSTGAVDSTPARRKFKLRRGHGKPHRGKRHGGRHGKRRRAHVAR